MSLPFTQRVVAKIISFLCEREGFTMEREEQTNDFVIREIRDSFGFRYEIRVRNLGRIDTEIHDFDTFVNAGEGGL